jgi:hypothetical protein
MGMSREGAQQNMQTMQNSTSGAMDTSGEQGGGQGKTKSLVAVNDLLYVLEPDLSVATNRTHKRHFFQSNSYTDQQNAICILNSGADYIDPRRSFLEFEVELSDADAACYLGMHGSICNLIRQITVSTRSGDEISRIQDYAHFINMMLPYSHDKEWFNTQGQLMEYGGFLLGKDTKTFQGEFAYASKKLTNTVGNGAASVTTDIHVNLKDQISPTEQDYSGNKMKGTSTEAVQNTDTTRKFLIPLYLISPFFQYNRLLPAMVMSGMRIEIEFNRPELAYVSGKVDSGTSVFTVSNTDAVRFTINKPIFNLCSVQLSDAIQRALNEQSAVNGLELVYCDYERTEAQLGGSGNTNDMMYVEVRKSCSRALKAFARVYNMELDTLNEDSLRGDNFPFVEYQWQLGSLYFPNQSVKAEVNNWRSTASIAPQAFSYFLDSVDKYHPASRAPMGTFRSVEDITTARQHRLFDTQLIDGGTSVALPTAVSKYALGYQRDRLFGQVGSYSRDQHVIGVTLERSTLFNLAGVPVNNSRVLALRGRLWSPGNGADAVKTGHHASTAYGNNGVGGTRTTAYPRRVLIYLKFVKLARVFLNNVEVEQ